jgi:hypothetical protein
MVLRINHNFRIDRVISIFLWYFVQMSKFALNFGKRLPGKRVLGYLFILKWVQLRSSTFSHHFVVFFMQQLLIHVLIVDSRLNGSIQGPSVSFFHWNILVFRALTWLSHLWSVISQKLQKVISFRFYSGTGFDVLHGRLSEGQKPSLRQRLFIL